MTQSGTGQNPNPNSISYSVGVPKPQPLETTIYRTIKIEVRTRAPSTIRPNKFPYFECCLRLAKNVALYCYRLPRNVINVEFVRQVVRASSSVGANYIETNEGQVSACKN